MIPSLIIMLRETLEITLIIGIILSYLLRSGQQQYRQVVWQGVAAGILTSILSGLLLKKIAGGFEGRTEEIFEGLMMLIGSALLTFMIIWMLRQKNIAKKLEHKISSHISNASRWGLFFLVFVSILREGVESVIFLQAASINSPKNNVIGAVLGMLVAVMLGFLIYKFSFKMNLRTFFTATGILLIIFAAGLIAHSSHEFIEAGVLNPIVDHLWDINPIVASDGGYPLWHEKGYAGSILTGLFGYNGNPSLLELIVYVGYLLATVVIWRTVNRRNSTV